MNLSDVVEEWAAVNGGNLNAMQVRALLAALRRLEQGLPWHQNA